MCESPLYYDDQSPYVRFLVPRSFSNRSLQFLTVNPPLVNTDPYEEITPTSTVESGFDRTGEDDSETLLYRESSDPVEVEGVSVGT